MPNADGKDEAAREQNSARGQSRCLPEYCTTYWTCTNCLGGKNLTLAVPGGLFVCSHIQNFARDEFVSTKLIFCNTCRVCAKLPEPCNGVAHIDQGSQALDVQGEPRGLQVLNPGLQRAESCIEAAAVHGLAATRHLLVPMNRPETDALHIRAS